jgi:hypothetical protein
MILLAMVRIASNTFIHENTRGALRQGLWPLVIVLAGLDRSINPARRLVRQIVEKYAFVLFRKGM